jgi:hypothetical protein
VNRPDVRLPRELDHPWHVEINRHSSEQGFGAVSWMYDAKHLAEEVPRLALLFGIERRGELPVIHHQCSRDHAGTPVPDNHLTCCLGVECRTCPHLAVVDRVKTRRDYSVHPSVELAVTDDERDVLKAWTCAAHIMRSAPSVDTSEGFVLTTDDRMYWNNVYASLSAGDPDDEERGGFGMQEQPQ